MELAIRLKKSRLLRAAKVIGDLCCSNEVEAQKFP